MKKRRVPQPLFNTVLELTTAIAQPDAVNEAAVDIGAAIEARAKLMELFHKHQEASTPDPFLTEAVADFTIDPVEAARLYRLAIEQCVGFPGEPLHTKRQGLIKRLLELRRIAEAREELVHARRAAFAAGDSEAIKELDALSKQMAV